MTLVLDASVLLAALLDNSPHGYWAESIIESHGLIAPDHLLIETMNGLRRLERSGDVSRLEANVAQRDATQLAMKIIPIMPFADRIWELRHNVTSHDAAYVAIAEVLEVPLATLDLRLAGVVNANSEIGCRFVTP
jgi:predicted nucleic acid-binding protein